MRAARKRDPAAARIAAGSTATSEPNVEEAYQRALARGERALTRRAGDAARATGTVRVPVVFHVITDGLVGSVADSVLDAQIAVLNDSYDGGTPGGAPSHYVFERVGTTRTDNSTWHEIISAEAQAKAALRQGGVRTLNLYVADADPYLGWATFPDEYAGNPTLDGVVVDYRALPGGAFGNYDEGETATHEVGHWLGLYAHVRGQLPRARRPRRRHRAGAASDERMPGEKETCPAVAQTRSTTTWTTATTPACSSSPRARSSGWTRRRRSTGTPRRTRRRRR